MEDFSTRKLQAMGLLAAGVAHDFNNLLSIIEGYSYILQQHLGNVPALQNKVAGILNATHRGAELTQLLLDFSHTPQTQVKTELIETINYARPILRSLMSSRIELDFQLPATTTAIDLTRQQIIEELIFMGKEIAATIKGAGRLVISTNITHENITLFMTNGENGEFVSRQLQHAHENRFQDKTILVVDDEEALLPVLEHQLQNMGLKVLKAANADTALLLQKDYPDVIDFLLTDIVMPDVGGVELAEMITDSRPRMGVVYMTGFGKNGLPEESLVVPKPLRPESLSAILQQALDKVTDA